MKTHFLGLKAAQFREKAERCREMAAKFENPYAKADLNAAAKGWAELADQQEAWERQNPTI